MKTQNLFILFAIVITLYPLTACSTGGNAVATSPAESRPPKEETLAQAKILFAEREDIGKLRRAVDLVAKLRDPQKRDFETEWQFAKYSYFLGKAVEDEKEREAIWEVGRDAAQSASGLKPDRADGYFWYAANLGELARASPVTVGLTSVGDIREAMNKVIELEPGYQGATAFDALAQIELTPLAAGKTEKAVEYLEKGISIEPNNSSMRLHLGQAYLKLNKEAKAREQLEYAVKMKPDPDYLPEHDVVLAEAKRLLSTRF